MAEMADPLARLMATEAVRNQIARYGLLADAGESTALAELWTENGEYDVGGFAIARGRKDIAALIESDTHRGLMAAGCAHILMPHAIELDDTSAVAEGYSAVFLKSEDRFEAWRLSWNRWEFEQQADGEWLVVRRINRPVEAGNPALCGGV